MYFYIFVYICRSQRHFPPYVPKNKVNGSIVPCWSDDKQPFSYCCSSVFRVLLMCAVPAFASNANCFIFASSLVCLNRREEAQLGSKVPKSFTLCNGLFAKSLCYLGTREVQSPKCLMLCSLAICPCFTTSGACVITPRRVGRLP